MHNIFYSLLEPYLQHTYGICSIRKLLWQRINRISLPNHLPAWRHVLLVSPPFFLSDSVCVCLFSFQLLVQLAVPPTSFSLPPLS